MVEKTKILFINDEMTLGGVSRILNTLLAMMDKDKYEIDLLILHQRGELLEEIPKGINILETDNIFEMVDLTPSELIKNKDYWGIVKKIYLFLLMKTGLIRFLIKKKRKKLLNKQYDVEFSAKEGFCTIFMACGNSKRKINWVQTDYEKENYAKHHMSLLRWALNRIDVNIACSEGVKDAFKKVFLIDNVVVIHNMINEDIIHNLANKEVDFSFFQEDTINLITVARFHPQKGLDRMIRAIKYLKEHQINVRLALIGNGVLWNEIHQLVDELDLTKEVLFMDYQLNPYPYIKKADLFLMTSLFEGYPTVTLETLLSSTPVFTTEVSGVREQLKNKEEGWIVENKDEIINQKLLEICQNKDVLTKYKEELKNYHYENEVILKEICEYIDGEKVC